MSKNPELGSLILKKPQEAPFIVVPTSAGSGKTELLAKRLVFLLLSECNSKNDLRKFLAITFTREAAKEMKRRVVEILGELRKGNFDRFPGLEEIFKDKLAERVGKVYDIVLENYPRLRIGTIDSFMERLRRLLLHELGLKFTLKVHYEVDVEVLNLAIENLLRSSNLFSDFLKIVVELAKDSERFEWDLLKAFNERIIKLKSAEDRLLYDLKPHPLFASIQWEDRKIGEEIARLQNSIPNVRKKMNENDSFLQLLEFLARGNNAYSFSNILLGKADLYERVFRGLLCAFGAYNKLETKIAEFYESFYKPEYRRILNTMGIITISDTSRIMRDYMLNPENYCDRLINFLYGINHILIDEFQDTDPQQWEILLYLIKEHVLSSGGTLFIVGDIKQAIYGFRKADYKIMYSLLSQDGYKRYGLNMPPFVPEINDRNFRSSEAIVKFVNDVVFKEDAFESFLQNEVKNLLEGVISKQKAEVKAQKIVERYRNIWIPIRQVAQKKEIGYVKNIKIPKTEGVRSKKEKLDKILPYIKELITELLGEFTPGEITVMARDNDMVLQIASFIERELAQPVICFSSLDIRSHKILWELISLVKFLIDEKDLKSAFVFATGTIAQKAVGKDTVELTRDFYEFVFRRFEADNELTRLFKSLKEKYSKFYEKKSLARLFSELLCGFEFLNEDSSRGAILRFLNFLFNSELREGYITVDKVEEIFNQFLDSMSNSQAEDLSIPQKTEINAIKVMTFHKSKGLGFPVVINVFIDSKGGGNDLYFDKEHKERLLYPFKMKKDYLKIIDSGLLNNEHTKRMMERYIEEKIDELVQEINTIYVALTRAKKRLYNIYMEDTYFKRLVEAGKADERVYGEIIKEKKEPLIESSEPPLITFYRRKNLPKVFIEPRREEFQTTDLISRLKASWVGDAVHEFLRTIDFIEMPEELIKYRDRMVAIADKYYIDSFTAEKILGVLVDFFSRDGRIKILSNRQGGELYREREIGLIDGSFERIDRLIVGKDFVEVIDFKTGEPKEEDIKQVKGYIKVLKKIFTAHEIKGYLAYVFNDQLKEVSDEE
ncbi:MAG: UvrD-helicase domain-containing protein [bacterium]|nr:UvrD-helicase domain-containing protein [bacterium]